MSALDTLYTGKGKVLSVGDEGKIQLATFLSDAVLSTPGIVLRIKVYTAAEFEGAVTPAPLVTLNATKVSADPEGAIEAANDGTIFPVAGTYYLRAYVDVSGMAVHGDPARIYVLKGSS